MDEIENSWSPLEQRKARDAGGSGNMKVRSMRGNTVALHGGDWISSRYGNATLGVAWQDSKTKKKYGLTVGHLWYDHCLGVGASVFAYDTDEPTMTNLDGSKGHKPIKVGTIQAIDVVLDFIIFEIFDHIKIDPLAVALSGGDDQILHIKLPVPGQTKVPPAPGQRLVLYGAARRGMVGRRILVDAEEDEIPEDMLSAKFVTKSYVTTPDGQVETNGALKLSFSGDCGGFYIDEDGTAWSMHTTIQGVPRSNPTVWTSRGTLLQDIVNAHPSFFRNTGSQLDVNSQKGSYRKQSLSPQFDCVALEKIVSLRMEAQSPSLCFRVANPVGCVTRHDFPQDSRYPSLWFSDEEASDSQEEKKCDD